MAMKLYVDDLRMPPAGFVLARSVNAAKEIILDAENKGETIDLIDLDHDMGDFASDGGDAICLLDWLVERDTLYPISVHTMNPVGAANMMRMIRRFWPDGEY